MRSAVCKKANQFIREGWSRSTAFKKAWAFVKKLMNSKKASELKPGDVVTIEYGDYNNFVTCTVIGVGPSFSPEFIEVEAVSVRSRINCDFCVEPDKMIQLAA